MFLRHECIHHVVQGSSYRSDSMLAVRLGSNGKSVYLVRLKALRKLVRFPQVQDGAGKSNVELSIYIF